MDWTEKIFRYCERGQDPSFWAEPLNAISNAAFIIAALFAAAALSAKQDRKKRIAEWGLVVLVFVIGVGSFLFHTYATRWAAVADVAPIGVFMLAYFAYALRVLLRANWLVVAAGLGAFIWALQIAGDIECRPGLLSITEAARGPCLNGTVGYAPALFAMLGMGGLLAALQHPGWRTIFAAGCVFLISMFFRTVDLEICDLTRIMGSARGVHFLWHILNATTLFLLLHAAIHHGSYAGRGRDDAVASLR